MTSIRDTTKKLVRIGVPYITQEMNEVHPMQTPKTPIFYMNYNYKGNYNGIYWDLVEREDFEFN